jgi:photosystem II stability/assembly factor-like uncharacterized protein
MKKFYLTITLIFFILTTKAQWLPTEGPWGGNIISATTKGTTILAVTTNKMYRSMDRGATWKEIARNVFRNFGATTIVNNGTAFFVSGYGGILVSFDDGDNWTVCAKYYLPNIAVRNKTLFAAGDMGVLYSNDDGKNFIDITKNLNINVDPTCLLITDKKIYVGSQKHGVFVLNDKDSSWQDITYNLPKVEHVKDVAVLDSLIFAITGGRIYVSSINSNNWVISDSGVIKKNISCLHFKDSVIFAGSHELYKYLTLEKRWKAISPDFFSPDLISTIIAEDSTLFICSTGGFMKSNNDGRDWYASNTGINATTTLQMLIYKDQLLAAASRAGVFLSGDRNTWENKNSNLDLLKALCLLTRDSIILVGTFGSGIYRSVNDGKSWDTVNSGLEGVFKGIYCLIEDGPSIYVSAQGGIHKSIDNGLSWKLINSYSGRTLLVHNKIFYLSAGAFTSKDSCLTWESNNVGKLWWCLYSKNRPCNSLSLLEKIRKNNASWRSYSLSYT